MPRREQERHENIREGKSGLRYCVFCKQYLSATEWALHPHNPDYHKPGSKLARGIKKLFRRK